MSCCAASVTRRVTTAKGVHSVTGGVGFPQQSRRKRAQQTSAPCCVCARSGFIIFADAASFYNQKARHSHSTTPPWSMLSSDEGATCHGPIFSYRIIPWQNLGCVADRGPTTAARPSGHLTTTSPTCTGRTDTSVSVEICVRAL